MSTDLQFVIKQVAELEQRVAADLARRRKTNRIALIGGGIIFLVVLGYFQFIHRLVLDVFEPKALMSYVRNTAEEYIPQGLAGIQLTLQKAAPEAARATRERSIAALPEIRKALEAQFLASADTYIKALEGEVDALIQQGIQDNRDVVARFVADPDDPAIRDQFATVVKESMKSLFDDPLLTADLRSYADTLNRINARCKRLRDGEKLTRSEQSERDLIVALRELARRRHDSREVLPQTP